MPGRIFHLYINFSIKIFPIYTVFPLICSCNFYKPQKYRKKGFLTVAGEFNLTVHGKIAKPPRCAIIRVLFLVTKCDCDDDVSKFWNPGPVSEIKYMFLRIIYTYLQGKIIMEKHGKSFVDFKKTILGNVTLNISAEPFLQYTQYNMISSLWTFRFIFIWIIGYM